MNPLLVIEHCMTSPLDHRGQSRFIINDWHKVLRRDPCVYCYEPAPSIDHIESRAAGGKNHWTNLAPACLKCNNKKGHTGLLMFLCGHSIHVHKQARSAPPLMLRDEPQVPTLTYQMSDLFTLQQDPS